MISSVIVKIGVVWILLQVQRLPKSNRWAT